MLMFLSFEKKDIEIMANFYFRKSFFDKIIHKYDIYLYLIMFQPLFLANEDFKFF